MDIQNMIQGFISLSTKDKQQKLLAILEKLQDSNQVFSSLLKKVSNSTPNDATLIVIYHDIMMFSKAVEEYNKTQDIISLSKAEQYMQKLLEREQQERLINEKDLSDMESLLENM